MIVRDKQSYNMYTAYKITRKCSIPLEMEQSINLIAMDYAIEIPELKAWLLMDNKDFDQRFSIVSDDTN